MEQEITMTDRRAAEIMSEKKLISKLKEMGVNIEKDGNTISLHSDGAFNGLLAKNVLIAFNRGFDAKTSANLLDGNFDIAVINISDYASSKKRQIELKGRVIGNRGIIKTRIMKDTSCWIKVYGKTVSIIGPVETIGIAVYAIEMILNGAKHDSVFSMINKMKLEMYINGNS